MFTIASINNVVVRSPMLFIRAYTLITVKILAKQDIWYMVEAISQVGPTTTRNPINIEEEQDDADLQRKKRYTRVQ